MHWLVHWCNGWATVFVFSSGCIEVSSGTGFTLWLCQNSYWKWPFIVDFPMKHGGSFHSYVTNYQRVPTANVPMCRIRTWISWPLHITCCKKKRPFSSSRPSRTSKNTRSHICVLVYTILVHTTCFEEKEIVFFFGRAALFAQPLLRWSQGEVSSASSQIHRGLRYHAPDLFDFASRDSLNGSKRRACIAEVGLEDILETRRSKEWLAGCKYMGLSENRVYSQWNSHLVGIMIINHWV